MNQNTREAPLEGTGTKPPDPEPSDGALARAAARGEILAFEALVERYYPSVRRLILSRIPDRNEADDLCQDVFLRVHEKLGGLKNPTSFRPWLFRLALNRLRDHRRRFRIRSWWVRPLNPDRAEAPDPASKDENGLEAALKKEFWDQVRRFIEDLAPREAEAFVLRYIEDLSLKEITETLGRNPNTVKTHLRRAVRKFKDRDILINHSGGTTP